MNPIMLRENAEACRDFMAKQAMLEAADAWEEDRKSYEVLRSGIRSLWHAVVDGDMDRVSVGYAMKEMIR